MTPKTEQLPHAEGFIVSEAPGQLSRDEVTIRGDTDLDNLKAGAVLGQHGGGTWGPFDPDSSEGNETAAGILCHDVDLTQGDVKAAIIERLAEVKTDYLVWGSNVSGANKTTAEASLLLKNIKFRDGPSTITTQST